MALAEATQLLTKLKDAFKKGDISGADAILSQLKIKLIQLPALPPTFERTPTAEQELRLAREVLEQAVLLSLKRQDESAMERSFAQLRTFYSDTKGLLPASAEEISMQGLNLLRLLVQNRIAEFHTELELLPPQAQQDPAIKQPIQLEQWLMEGAYNKVLDASKQSSSEYHAVLLGQLATTVRDEVASCSEKAYEKLRTADAQRFLKLDSAEALRTYAEQHGWQLQGDYIVFQQSGAAAAAQGVPSMDLINNALVYAKELDRIV